MGCSRMDCSVGMEGSWVACQAHKNEKPTAWITVRCDAPILLHCESIADGRERRSSKFLINCPPAMVSGMYRLKNLWCGADSILFLVFRTVTAGAAQSNPQQALTADLARYYFASPEAELAARADLAQALKVLQSYEGHLDNGPKLLLALQAYEKVQTLYHKHDGYLHLRCARNPEDTACGDEQQLESTTKAQTGFLAPAILALGRPRIDALLTSEPRLSPYRFALEQMLRESEHILPKDLQECLDRFQPEIADW